MKITVKHSNHGGRGKLALTITELLVSLSIFSLMTMGMIGASFFGLKQDEMVNSKLGANNQARRGFDLLISDIRNCKNVFIGDMNGTNFVPASDGHLQQGTAIHIIPGTNTNSFVRYYFDTATSELDRIEDGDASATVIAQYLTNQMIFQATDYTGTHVLTVTPTEYNHNYVINMSLGFYQYQYPLTKVGPDYLFNSYQLHFRATRRSP